MLVIVVGLYTVSRANATVIGGAPAWIHIGAEFHLRLLRPPGHRVEGTLDPTGDHTNRQTTVRKKCGGIEKNIELCRYDGHRLNSPCSAERQAPTQLHQKFATTSRVTLPNVHARQPHQPTRLSPLTLTGGAVVSSEAGA